MKTLRQRCQEIAGKISTDGILRQGNPVDTIMEFVLAETGRKASPKLKESLPLVLYFKDDAERDEFIELFRQAKPGMISRKLP